MGTLVRLADPALALATTLRIDPDSARRAIAREIAYYRAHHDEAVDERTLAQLRGRCAEVVRASLAGDGHAVDPDRALAALMDSLRMPAYPDAEPALRDLRARGLRTAVVSNWDVSLHDVLRREGLSELFDAIVTSASTGAAKPQRAIFDAALRAVGTEAATAVHVGDSVDKDVDGALAAGIGAILLRRPGDPDTVPPPPGVPTIASLDELRQHLA